MQKIRLRARPENIDIVIDLPRSKSESNRALILAQLAQGIEITGISTAEDSQIMQACLIQTADSDGIFRYNVGAAGTTMRFLTAFCAAQADKVFIISGSERMHLRPIAPLVDALRTLGAEVEYTGQTGFPPLLIRGKKLVGNTVNISGSVSSQYISALMLIAPTLSNGLNIVLTSPLVSAPYAAMTAQMMQHFGAKVTISPQLISVESADYQPQKWAVEADWSAASYWFSLTALSRRPCRIVLKGLREDTLQPDSAVVKLYKNLGVQTDFSREGIIIQKNANFARRNLAGNSFVDTHADYFQYSFEACPDIAQTLACTCAGLGIKANLKGLQTLPLKETNRLAALQKELNKIAQSPIASIAPDALKLKDGKLKTAAKNLTIATYDDHRMAMAFAPLALCLPSLDIENPPVVAKSYPHFWDDMAKVFDLEILESNK
jgi:3-phosphoshikimate 1-carboxyvinyltransferase